MLVRAMSQEEEKISDDWRNSDAYLETKKFINQLTEKISNITKEEASVDKTKKLEETRMLLGFIVFSTKEFNLSFERMLNNVDYILDTSYIEDEKRAEISNIKEKVYEDYKSRYLCKDIKATQSVMQTFINAISDPDNQELVNKSDEELEETEIFYKFYLEDVKELQKKIEKYLFFLNERGLKNNETCE